MLSLSALIGRVQSAHSENELILRELDSLETVQRVNRSEYPRKKALLTLRMQAARTEMDNLVGAWSALRKVIL